MKKGIKIYGYVRVSHKDQNEGRQIAAMKAAGITPEWIYSYFSWGGEPLITTIWGDT